MVIKNVGDCLTYYFSGSDSENLRRCLESSLIMVDAHEMICEQLKKEGLPRVDYRISLDYRAGVLMRTSDSTSPDMIGPTLNMCSKISRLASKNGIVVGGDMYQRVKGYKESSLIR